MKGGTFIFAIKHYAHCISIDTKQFLSDIRDVAFAKFLLYLKRDRSYFGSTFVKLILVAIGAAAADIIRLTAKRISCLVCVNEWMVEIPKSYHNHIAILVGVLILRLFYLAILRYARTFVASTGTEEPRKPSRYSSRNRKFWEIPPARILSNIHIDTSRPKDNISTLDGAYALRFCKNKFDIHYFSLINREAFRRGPYSYGIDDILERNHEIYEKNSFSSAFIAEAGKPDNIIGMSHVFPLEPTFGDLYRTGTYSDSELRGRHIAAPGGEWFHLVLFSIGLFSDFRARTQFGPTHLRDIFMIHAKTHLMFRHRRSKSITILVQIDATERLLKTMVEGIGFRDTEVYTKDLSRIYEYKLELDEVTT